MATGPATSAVKRVLRPKVLAGNLGLGVAGLGCDMGAP